MRPTKTTSDPRRPPAAVPAVRMLVALLGALCVDSTASYWSLQGGGSLDNEGLTNQRAAATWYSEGTRWGYPQARVSWHRLTTGTLAGIPGGEPQDAGFLGTWITGVRTVRLTAAAGMDIVQDPSSWRGEFQGDWNTGILRGMRATFKASSGTMEGWFARDARATSAKAALGWDGPRTWAETGVQVEDRSGGRQPESELAVSLPYDRVTTAWVWATRSWTPWLQAGLSASLANSTVETHQPVNHRDDTLEWVDYPYESPHEAASVSGLLRVSKGPAWISTAWPLWSTERRRVESVNLWDDAYWYTLENAAMAEIRAGGDVVVARRFSLGLEAVALSRPYAPRAWFTGDAWNSYGLTLTLRFAT